MGVSLSIATEIDHVPIDFQLYLPESWANDEKRRKQAHIPKRTLFKTKPEIALGMLKRAVKQRLPRGVVLADAGYGSSLAFRDGVRKLKLDYAVGVDPKTSVWCVEGRSTLSSERLSVRDLATKTRGGRKLPALHVETGNQRRPLCEVSSQARCSRIRRCLTAAG
ncbi:MAG: endonuclease [Myxococcaceae bacterium]|nr:endonuclease [Myxococcaceae bacterium]